MANSFKTRFAPRMSSFFDFTSRKDIAYEVPQFEFSIFLTNVWHKKDDPRGYGLEIRFYRTETGPLGGVYRTCTHSVHWDTPFRGDTFRKAMLLKRIVRRMLVRTGMVPDLHGVAMRI